MDLWTVCLHWCGPSLHLAERVLLNCPIVPVWGTQSAAWWKHVHHSNKPFHMLCLKTSQELIKIKTNHFISIHYFLFFSLFQILPYWTKQHSLKQIIWHSKFVMQKIIPWKYLQLPPNLLFPLTQRATKSQGSDESKLLKKGTAHHLASNGVYWAWHSQRRRKLHTISTCISKWWYIMFYWNCS